MNTPLNIFSKLLPNVRRLPLCHWCVYSKNLRNLENVHAVNYENSCSALQLILRLCLEYRVRKNSAAACLIGHYLIGSEVLLTCYWDIPKGCAFKATLTFLCGRFQTRTWLMGY